VTFSFGLPATHEPPPGGDDDTPWDVYRLEAVRPILGGHPPADLASISLGSLVGRREIESVRLPSVVGSGGSGGAILQGAVDLKHSSGDDETNGLMSSWARSPWRVALVLLFSHTPAFWTLPSESRSQTYLGWNTAHLSKRSRIMGRVLRRLYRAGSLPASQWDYLAYLEMQPQDVAHVREHLAELRDPKRNPLHAQVAREAELWLTKQVGGSAPARGTLSFT
jgi:hypothetical protein